MAVISLRNLAGKRRYGLFSRTVIFGYIDAARRYNVFSRIISELACKLHALPPVSYFDDFGEIAPSALTGKPLGDFAILREHLGI